MNTELTDLLEQIFGDFFPFPLGLFFLVPIFGISIRLISDMFRAKTMTPEQHGLSEKTVKFYSIALNVLSVIGKIIFLAICIVAGSLITYYVGWLAGLLYAIAAVIVFMK